jgi:hypothetical protein
METISSSHSHYSSSPVVDYRLSSSGDTIIDEKDNNNKSNVEVTIYPNDANPKKNIPSNQLSKDKSKDNLYNKTKLDKYFNKANDVQEISDDEKKENSVIVIEIDEEKKMLSQLKDGLDLMKKKKKRTKKKSQFINGYTPFIFYEK